MEALQYRVMDVFATAVSGFVCSLSAAGAGNFYQKCVLPTTTYLREMTFDTFGAHFIVQYGPLTNCAIAASVLALVCLVINLIFYYVGSNIMRLRVTSKEGAFSPEKRVTIGAMTAQPSSFRNNSRSVDEDMNHGDIYTNAGRD